jgi:hypothetical protein
LSEVADAMIEAGNGINRRVAIHDLPYQRRAKHAGQCGVEVEGGRVPTADWFLNVRRESAM